MSNNPNRCPDCGEYVPGQATGAGDVCDCPPKPNKRPLWVKTDAEGRLSLGFDRMAYAVEFIEAQSKNCQWWSLWTFEYHLAKNGRAIAKAIDSSVTLHL